MEFEELERKAYKGEPLPELLPQYQQLAYLELRQLYWQFFDKKLTKENASKEKKAIEYAYKAARKKDEFEKNHFKYVDNIRIALAKINLEIKDHGCNLCQQMVDILDGKNIETGGIP